MPSTRFFRRTPRRVLIVSRKIHISSTPCCAWWCASAFSAADVASHAAAHPHARSSREQGAPAQGQSQEGTGARSRCLALQAGKMARRAAAAAVDLRSHVAHRARLGGHAVGVGEGCAAGQEAAETEVCEARAAVGAHQDVAWLQVTMHDGPRPPRVQVAHSRGDPRDQLQ
eukprot:scaffold2482_cov407-Prasinococcus_capsulatus_cf.AAC.8